MIGILCAMDSEIAYLLDEMLISQKYSICGCDYLEGSLRGRNVVLCRCGVGKVNAAMAAQTMILRFPVKLLINCGVAGGLREPLKIGDICVATDLVQFDYDTSAVGDPVGMVSTVRRTYFPCAPGAVEGILRAARECGIRSHAVRIGTGDQFINDAEKRHRIIRLFDAYACEMEGCAVAQVCFLNGVDCAVIRAISDMADGAQPEYEANKPLAAKNSALVTMKFVENTLR